MTRPEERAIDVQFAVLGEWFSHWPHGANPLLRDTKGDRQIDAAMGLVSLLRVRHGSEFLRWSVARQVEAGAHLVMLIFPLSEDWRLDGDWMRLRRADLEAALAAMKGDEEARL